MAAEDALTAVLEGSRSSPPLKHITINFWQQETEKNYTLRTPPKA